jgi:hypothetical protein
MAAPLQDFGSVLRALLRFGRYASYALIGVTVWFLALRVADGARFFADIHPALGWAFLAVVLAACAWFLGRPIARFLRVPVALRPPRLPASAERTPRDLVRHLVFVERYVLSLARNIEWKGAAPEAEAVAAECRALAARAATAPPADLPALVLEVAVIERRRVGALLAPLDARASEIIRGEALAVGVATAVSFNGTVDAFLVLWRNLNLVSRLANLYYGRPGTRGTLAILRDVSAATLASAYLQDVSEAAGGALGTMVGKSAGALAGPLLDGAMNAVVTARIGYLAKARCRAFAAWTERTRVQVLQDALSEAALVTTGLVGDLLRTVGGGLFRWPGRVFGAVTSTVSGWFRRDPAPGGEAAPAGP